MGLSGDRREPEGLATRQTAASRLAAVLSGQPFAALDETDLADSRDRALANRLITTALRRHGHITAIISGLLDRGLPAKSGSFEAVLRLSLAQLLFLPQLGAHSSLFLAGEALKRDRRAQHLVGLMNAVLRRAQSRADEFTALDPVANLPDWLRARWQSAYGADNVGRFATALLEGAPLDLTLRDDDPALVAALGATPVHADTVRVNERDAPVAGLPGYTQGRFWVQDAAAAIPARLIHLPRGARVLDLCAAPGGKTAQLVKAGLSVTAVDSGAERLLRMQANLSRLGFSAILENQDAARYSPKETFDAVLLDAPCSATGTFRRHPEVIWHRAEADLRGRAELQRGLLANAVACLNPGGVLVYCTCSLEPEEGEEQARWLMERGGVIASPIAPSELGELAQAVTTDGHVRTHPGLAVPEPAGGTLDGFFVARFTRS